MKKRNGQLAALLLAIVMILSFSVTPIFAAGDQTFKDVPESAWYHGYVEMLFEKGVVKGYGTTGEFRPNNKLIREHASKMVALAAGLPYQGKKADFPDVDKEGEMSPYIAALQDKGAIQGFPDGTFKPKNNIQRGHAAKIVALAFGLLEGDMVQALTDLPQDAGVKAAIEILESNGVVKGYGDTKLFKPEEEISRAEFAKILCIAMVVASIQEAEADPTPENIAAAQALADQLPPGQDGPTQDYLQGRLEELEEEEEDPPVGPTTIAVSAISVDKTETLLKPEATETLIATVEPSNATNRTVTWSSDKPSVATVDADGEVTAKSTGIATITARAGNKTATTIVKVINITDLTKNYYDKNETLEFKITNLNPNEETTVGININQWPILKPSEKDDAEGGPWYFKQQIIGNQGKYAKESEDSGWFFKDETDENGVLTVSGTVSDGLPSGKLYITLGQYDFNIMNQVDLGVYVGNSDFKDSPIQATIDDAMDGHEIVIDAGEFTEDLTVDKKLTIQSGHGRDATTIKGHHKITADKVIINDFTFITKDNATTGDYTLYAKGTTGVEINNSIFDGQKSPSLDYKVNAIYAGDNMTIEDTTIKNGFYVSINGYPENLTVKNSTITNVKSGINVQGSGNNLVVENTNIDVVVQAKENSTYAIRFASKTAGGNTMSITGGTLTVNQNEIDYDVEEHSAIVVRAGAGVGTYSISGATINGSVWDAANQLVLSDVLSSNTFPAGYKVAGNKIMKPVAHIGEQAYETIQTAITAATDNDTVTLLKDVTIESADFMHADAYAVMISGKKLTLDLNGKTLSADAEATVYIGSDGELTLKDTSSGGKIVNSRWEAVGNYGTFTMERGTLKPTNGYALYNYYWAGDMYGTATIEGGTLTGGDRGIANCGILEISGGSITGTTYDIDNSGKLTFSGNMTLDKMLLKDGSDAPELDNKGTMVIADGVTISGESTDSTIKIEEGAIINIEGTNNFYSADQQLDLTNIPGKTFKWDGNNWVAIVEGQVINTTQNKGYDTI